MGIEWIFLNLLQFIWIFLNLLQFNSKQGRDLPYINLWVSTQSTSVWINQSKYCTMNAGNFETYYTFSIPRLYPHFCGIADSLGKYQFTKFEWHQTFKHICL